MLNIDKGHLPIIQLNRVIFPILTKKRSTANCEAKEKKRKENTWAWIASLNFFRMCRVEWIAHLNEWYFALAGLYGDVLYL